MKKIFTALFCLSAVFILNITLVKSNPEGAPYPGYSNAPGEGNCTSCHLGTVVNPSNGGTTAVTVTGNPTSYTPGQTYEVNVTVSYTGRTRFGFDLTAKKSGTATNLGTLSTNGNTKVKVVSSTYITHSNSGTTGNTDAKTWKFNWVAPATANGPVTFYISGMAANNNGNEGGDYVYTNSLTLPAATSSGLPHADANHNLLVYPNPVKETLNINYQSQSDVVGSAVLIDITGRERSLGELKFVAGNNTISIATEGLEMKGLCFLKLTVGDKVVIRKIFLD